MNKECGLNYTFNITLFLCYRLSVFMGILWDIYYVIKLQLLLVKNKSHIIYAN